MKIMRAKPVEIFCPYNLVLHGKHGILIISKFQIWSVLYQNFKQRCIYQNFTSAVSKFQAQYRVSNFQNGQYRVSKFTPYRALIVGEEMKSIYSSNCNNLWVRSAHIYSLTPKMQLNFYTISVISSKSWFWQTWIKVESDTSVMLIGLNHKWISSKVK